MGLIGTRIGSYELLEQIGEGGVGVVYRARDVALDRVVAIKALRSDFLANEAIVARFRSEAQTLARLQHPNIALLFSLLEHEHQLWMVMEYIQGETFSALLRRSGALPPRRAIELLLQALNGIGYAHAQGVVHRDIKASNLMWSDAGQVKLMDFGIAIAFGSSRVTRMGHMVGTLQYMAPEQVRGRATDARSDLYSLGIVLYHLLAGKLPFRSENDYELMRAQVDREPPPLADHGVAVPPALEAALRRALAKEPSERFADAAEFAAALAPILAELPADPAAHERESGAAHRTANAASPERQTDVVSALPELDAPSPATLSDLPFTELPSLTELGARALPDRPRRHGRWELAGAAAALAVLALSVDLLLFQPTPRAPAAPRLADEAAIDAHARAKVELRSESSATPHAATPLAAEVAREALSQLGWAGPSDPLPNAELTSEPHPRSTAKPRSPRPVQRTEQPRSHKPESQQWIIRR